MSPECAGFAREAPAKLEDQVRFLAATLWFRFHDGMGVSHGKATRLVKTREGLSSTRQRLCIRALCCQWRNERGYLAEGAPGADRLRIRPPYSRQRTGPPHVEACGPFRGSGLTARRQYMAQTSFRRIGHGCDISV